MGDDEQSGGLQAGLPKKALFWITVDEDFTMRYPNTMSEIEIRGWLDKVSDGIKESMRMRAMIASSRRT